MRNKIILPFILAATLTACSNAKTNYWPQLQNAGINSSYCKNNLQNPDEVYACELDSLALERAKSECKKDTSPELCLTKAKSGWEEFKSIASIGGKVTKKMAQEYPVMCGFKENNIKLCTPQSGVKTLRY